MAKFTHKNKSAVTLVEILIAMVLMASAFLPIMAVMSTSMKATQKDENSQRAVRLCQEKLNMVLQMPFNKFGAGLQKPNIYDYNEISLKIGEDTIDGIKFTSSLYVDNVDVTFKVPSVDWQKKYENESDPSQWNFQMHDFVIKNKVKKFTVQVDWQDRGNNEKPKFYKLSAIKADIREDS